MLKIKNSAAAMPAQDIKRAREFYEQKLGLKAEQEEGDGGALYRTGETLFLVFVSTGKASGDHTQMALEVEDVVSAASELKSKGVKFEEYDHPNFKTKDGRQSIQYPQRVKIEGSRIYLPKVGWVKCVVHREIIGKFKTVTISRSSDSGWTLPSIGTTGNGNSRVISNAIARPDRMLAAETVPHNSIHTRISQHSTQARSATRLICSLLFARALIAVGLPPRQ